MAKKGMQEKYQILMPPEYETAQWKDPSSARKISRHGESFNEMPPGQDMMNQNHVERFVDGGLAGETSVTDHVSSSLENGYTRGDMTGLDDQQTGDSVDLWYGEVGSGKHTGFLTRNNYLDRLS